MPTTFKSRSSLLLVLAIVTAMVFATFGIMTDTAYGATKKPKKITLTTTAKTVDIKGTVKVSVKSVKPAKAKKSVTYKSSNKKIATVSKNGTVKGLKTGTVTIKVTSKYNKKATAKIKIKVKDIKPTSVSLSKSKATLSAGDQFTLKATVKPAYGLYNSGVTFSSSNTKVAEVTSKGAVTANAPGTAKITASTKEGGCKAYCTITVSDDNVLNGWVLTGYYKSSKINNTAIDSNVQCRMWDSSAKSFKGVKNSSSNILGNYIQLYDKDGDKDADLIHIVKYADGAGFWDANMTWYEGAGDTEPYVSDETGEEMFSQNFRIPMGERLLTTYGLGSYSGTTDFNNYEDSPYWENTDYDYYTLDSSSTLTMLTNYKTALQTTGSTCVMTSELSVLEWYGVRGDLNERDLSSLRGEDRAGKVGGTSLSEAKTVFKKLTSLGITGKWNMTSWDSDDEKLYDPEWIQGELEKGHPIIVIWNSYGAHGQVIIGYDSMGTEQTNDDVLILMDPYDTTDHNADGYTIQSYERLAYGLLTWNGETTGTHFLSVWPSGWEYSPTTGDGMIKDKSNKGNFSDVNKIPYGNTAADIQEYYPKTTLYDDSLSGAAGVERSGDYDKSPYYTLNDYYGTEAEVRDSVGSDTLKILDNYKTIQQSTEWTCGVTSALMAITHFDKNQPRTEGTFGAGELETDISLATHRENAKTGATHRSGMIEIFEYMNEEYDQDWVYFTNLDLDDPYGEESYIGDYCLQAGSETPGWDGLIPYLIDNDIPMIIGWDEWGGHWQTIIGYDSMGTEGTQDDVLILADSYDTTDHNQDGYVVESFERLVYGWNAAFEAEEDGSDDCNDFIVAFPAEGHDDVIKALGL